MKCLKYTLVIFLAMVSVAAILQKVEQHDREKRTIVAVRTLHNIYVLTPSQSLKIVYANSWAGNTCLEYVTDDARQLSMIRFAVLEKDSQSINYDMDRDDLEGTCNMDGIDLTNVAERELKDESENGAPK